MFKRMLALDTRPIEKKNAIIVSTNCNGLKNMGGKRINLVKVRS